MGEQHTGGMIALVPEADAIEQMALPGGEAPEEVHLTLTYLGDDVRGLTEADHAELTHQVMTAAAHMRPIVARVFGHATFNPDGYADREPCAVYLVGDCAELAELHDRFAPLAAVDQHRPYIPHVTGGYGRTAADLTFTGPVVFTHLRLALAGTNVLIPFMGNVVLGEEKAARPRHLQAVDPRRRHTAAFALGVAVGLRGLGEDDPIRAELIQVKAGPPGHTFPSPDPGATKLRNFWTRSKEGLAKWDPTRPGRFKRLVRHLRKYVGERAEGLAAIYYRQVMGHWPGKHNQGHKAAGVRTLDELLAGVVAQLAHDTAHMARETKMTTGPKATEDDELLASLDKYEALGEGITTEDAYEQALADDVTWEAGGDGELHRMDKPGEGSPAEEATETPGQEAAEDAEGDTDAELDQPKDDAEKAADWDVVRQMLEMFDEPDETAAAGRPAAGVGKPA